jgi:hypothetical protein
MASSSAKPCPENAHRTAATTRWLTLTQQNTWLRRAPYLTLLPPKALLRFFILLLELRVPGTCVWLIGARFVPLAFGRNSWLGLGLELQCGCSFSVWTQFTVPTSKKKKNVEVEQRRETQWHPRV